LPVPAPASISTGPSVVSTASQRCGALLRRVPQDGTPAVVRIEGYEYKLCKGGQTDGCINPQDAGFDWGGKEIKYWPGRPASEIEGPLPEYEPDAPKEVEGKAD
jgi:hypothetical protein